MLNESSENSSYLYKIDSDDPSLNRKYSRKSKFIKKKNQESGYLPNRKKKCLLFDQGKCKNGGLCSFSHSFIPDIAKKQCKNFGINSCKKGQFCPFSHNLSRFPCKQQFILGNCWKGRTCSYSHEDLDPDFYQDFFEDNLDFVFQAFEQGKNLTQKCQNFSKKINIEARSKKRSELQNQYRFSLYFGAGFTRSSSAKNSNNENEQKQKTDKAPTKKQLKNKQPFSIRLTSKNRIPIPEQLFQPLPMSFPYKTQEGDLAIKQNWEYKEQDENMDDISEKSPLRIQLTPEQDVGPKNNFSFNQYLN